MPSDHLILCHPVLLPSIFPSFRVFSKDSALRFRWSKHWSFSISPSKEYSGLISFRIDWFDLAVQWTLKSSLELQFKSISSSVISLLYGPTFTTIKALELTLISIALSDSRSNKSGYSVDLLPNNI